MTSCHKTSNKYITYKATVVYQTKVVKIGGYEPKVDSVSYSQTILLYDIKDNDEIIASAITITTHQRRQFTTTINIQSNNSNKIGKYIDWFEEGILLYDSNIQYEMINTRIDFE